MAIGSDFDGFIKPTMGGLESSSDLANLRAPLTDRYGADAEKILTDNACAFSVRSWPDGPGLALPGEAPPLIPAAADRPTLTAMSRAHGRPRPHARGAR